MAKSPAKSEAKASKPKTAKAKTPKPKAARPEGASPKRVRMAGRACKIQNCKRSYKAKGYCKPHYRAWRQGEYGVARYKQCVDINCSKPMTLNHHGFCEEHFQSYYVKGNAVAKAAPAEKPAPAEKATA